MSEGPRIELAGGAEEIGLAVMLSDLIRQNLSQRPRKRADFDSLDVRILIRVTDADVAVTLDFAGGHLKLDAGANGPQPGGAMNSPAGLLITTSADTLLALCMVKVSRGIPNIFNRDGMNLVKSLLRGEVKIAGALRHPIQLLRFTRLMSVKDTRT